MTITDTINETALRLLKENPDGLRWIDLNRNIQEAHPDFHPKTINGCVWKLVENFPNQVKRTEDKLFKLK